MTNNIKSRQIVVFFSLFTFYEKVEIQMPTDDLIWNGSRMIGIFGWQFADFFLLINTRKWLANYSFTSRNSKPKKIAHICTEQKEFTTPRWNLFRIIIWHMWILSNTERLKLRTTHTLTFSTEWNSIQNVLSRWIWNHMKEHHTNNHLWQ